MCGWMYVLCGMGRGIGNKRGCFFVLVDVGALRVVV